MKNIQDAATEAAANIKDTAKSIPAKLRILVADDRLTNQKVTLLLLASLGYDEADGAQNGLEVLDALQNRSYDIVFMDVQMPTMNGLEATRSIRGDHQDQSGPYIIGLTGSVMPGDRELCLAAGMNDYLMKPFDRSDLQAAIENAKL